MELNKRFLEFDFSRSLTLAIMPLSHIVDFMIMLGLASNDIIYKYTFIEAMAPFGAAAFVVCLGINLQLNSKATPSSYIKRAGALFAGEIVLNIIRSLIPGVLAYLVMDEYSLFEDGLYVLFSSDILFFGALCFLFFALVKKLNIAPIYTLMIGVALSLINQLLPTENIVCSEPMYYILGNFIYINSTSYFAFCQWLIFPAFGYYFGQKFVEANNKGLRRKFWQKSGIISFCCTALFITVIKLLNLDFSKISGNQVDSFNMSTIGALTFISGIVFCMFLISLLCETKWLKSIEYYYVQLSKRITYFFIIQWIIVAWSVDILYACGVFLSDEITCFVVIAIIYVMTVSLSYYLSGKLQKAVTERFQRKDCV